MAAIGSVWGTGTWSDDIWGENTWGETGEAVEAEVRGGVSIPDYQAKYRQKLDIILKDDADMMEIIKIVVETGIL